MKIDLTSAELKAVLWAIGMQTYGNARDVDEMVLCGMTVVEARALVRAETKLEQALPIHKTGTKAVAA